MGRPTTTGSLEWRGDHWRARVTVNKKRRWVKLPATILESQEAKARKAARSIAVLAAAGKLDAPALRPRTTAPAPAGETFAAWLDRWLLARKARGLKSNQSDASKVARWIGSRLGERPVAQIARAEIEAWVEWIDSQVQADRLSWKTAMNAWGLLSRAMADASRGKVKALRVRDDNPCADVAPPDRGASKSKVYLYPSEVLALLGCVEVPLAVRRAYAVTVYLYPRAGEVEALHWDDLDLVHGVVHIHRAVDPETRKTIRGTKGKAARRFDLEVELVPLLQAMRAERPADTLVFEPWPLHKDRAGQLRKHLSVAGVKRAELFASDNTRKNVTFHDLRATGTTWAAIRGDDPLKIMHRAGHKDLATTQVYIREAENVGRDFGEVFPPLPEELTGTRSLSPDLSPVAEVSSQKAVKPVVSAVRGKGFEHHRPPASPADTQDSPKDSPLAIPSLSGSEGLPEASGTNAGTNPREVLVAHLRAAAASALEVGDFEAARVAVEALAQLGAGQVMDLRAARRRA
jgi:integrase